MQEIAPSWLFLVPLGVVLTWAACRWWYGRQRHRLEHRLGKIQADRDGLQEQVKRARQQIAQLQKDLSAWRLAAVTPAAAKADAAPATTAKPAAPPGVKAMPELPGGLVFEAPQLAAHGFADTLPFESEAPVRAARKVS